MTAAPNGKPARIPRNPEKAFELGVKTGMKITKDEALQQVRAETFGFLNEEYLRENIRRGSEVGDAILDLVRKLSAGPLRVDGQKA